jgi:hypothetical protein
MFLSVHGFPVWECQHHRSGFGSVVWIDFKRFSRETLGEGFARSQDEGLFRVFSSGTDVTGVGVRQSTPVGRCLSIADASLSLSLSLLSQ